MQQIPQKQKFSRGAGKTHGFPFFERANESEGDFFSNLVRSALVTEKGPVSGRTLGWAMRR
jgi:hypothetical protein